MTFPRHYTLLAAAAVVLLMGLFPPWKGQLHPGRPVHHVGFYAVWSTPYAAQPEPYEPRDTDETFRTFIEGLKYDERLHEWEEGRPLWRRPLVAQEVHVSMLVVQWLGTCLTATLLYVALRDRS